MQPVPAAVKNAFDASVIKKQYKAIINWITNIDKTGTITAGEFNSTYFAKNRINNGIKIPTVKKPFIKSSSLKLSGGPFYKVQAGLEYGWLGANRSDANGEFASPEILQIDFSTTQNIKSISVYSSGWNYLIDFDLYYKDTSGTWVLLEEYNAQSTTQIDYLFSSIAAVDGVKLSITKISCADMFAGVVEIDIGLIDNVSGDIVSMDITKETEYESGSLNIGNISADKLTLVLENTDRRYNSSNTSSEIYKYLKANKEIKPYIGIDVGGAVTYIPQGVFYIKDIVPLSDMTVRIECVDKMALLNEVDFNTSLVYQNKTISELIEIILLDYGLTSDQYNIEATTDIIPYGFFSPAKYAFHIKELAIAEGGLAYFDELGIFQFKNRSFTPGTVCKAYSASNILKADRPYISSRMRNRVVISSKPLAAGATDTVFGLNDTITILAGETKTIPCFFTKKPCINVADAVIVKHSGIDLDSEHKYSYGTFLTFTNNNATDQDITEITIDADPLEEQGYTLADEKDQVLIDEYLEKSYSVDSKFIQSYSYARQLATDLLNTWKDPEAEIGFDSLSMPYLQKGDRISVTYPKLNLNAVEYKIVSVHIKCGRSIIDTIKARRVL